MQPWAWGPCGGYRRSQEVFGHIEPHLDGRAVSLCNGQPLFPKTVLFRHKKFHPSSTSAEGWSDLPKDVQEACGRACNQRWVPGPQPTVLVYTIKADTNPGWGLDLRSLEGSESRNSVPVPEPTAETVPLVPEGMVTALLYLGVSLPGGWLWKGRISVALQHPNDAFWGSSLAISWSADWQNEGRKGLRVSW